jgi:hypothetical protein
MEITFLKESIYNAADFVLQAATSASQHIVQISQSAYGIATPYLKSVCEKIQAINVLEVLKSNTTIAVGLIGLCIGCALITRQVDHNFAKGCFTVAAVVAAVFAGIFLLNPALLQPVFGLV